MGFDTPYIIGVIRAEETKLLQEDEYTRMIETPTLKEAAHVLVDTPYGNWLSPDTDVSAALKALEERLVSLQGWLNQMVNDERVLEFIQARYDGLNAAAAVLDRIEGRESPQNLSRLGSIMPETWHSVVWNNVGGEALPRTWQEYVREMLVFSVNDPEVTRQAIDRAEAAVTEIMRNNARTDLEKDVLAWQGDRLACDRELRGGETADVTGLAGRLRPNYPAVTEAALQAVQNRTSSAAYEQAWDTELMRRIRPYQYEPVGYDAILAFWYAVEMEAKSVRLILTARAQGLPTSDVRALQRPMYLSKD